jgi:hypothetical protein
MKIVTAAKSRPKSQARLRDDNRRSAILCTIDFTLTIFESQWGKRKHDQTMLV